MVIHLGFPVLALVAGEAKVGIWVHSLLTAEMLDCGFVNSPYCLLVWTFIPNTFRTAFIFYFANYDFHDFHAHVVGAWVHSTEIIQNTLCKIQTQPISILLLALPGLALRSERGHHVHD